MFHFLHSNTRTPEKTRLQLPVVNWQNPIPNALLDCIKGTRKNCTPIAKGPEITRHSSTACSNCLRTRNDQMCGPFFFGIAWACQMTLVKWPDLKNNDNWLGQFVITSASWGLNINFIVLLSYDWRSRMFGSSLTVFLIFFWDPHGVIKLQVLYPYFELQCYLQKKLQNKDVLHICSKTWLSNLRRL